MGSTYVWGGRKFPVAPEVAAEEINRIIERDGVCPPESLVREASLEGHPLHHVFEWRDDVAAEKWRRHQARNIINAIRVTVQEGDGEIVAPAFVSVGHSEKTSVYGAGYRSVGVVVTNRDMADEALEDAIARLRSMRQRYAGLSALASVWAAIDDLENTG